MTFSAVIKSALDQWTATIRSDSNVSEADARRHLLKECHATSRDIWPTAPCFYPATWTACQ